MNYLYSFNLLIITSFLLKKYTLVGLPICLCEGKTNHLAGDVVTTRRAISGPFVMSPLICRTWKWLFAKWREQRMLCSAVCVAGRRLPVGRDSPRIYIPQPLSDHPRKSLYLMGTEMWSPICSDQPADWQTAALSIFFSFPFFVFHRKGKILWAVKELVVYWTRCQS